MSKLPGRLRIAVAVGYSIVAISLLAFDWERTQLVRLPDSSAVGLWAPVLCVVLAGVALDRRYRVQMTLAACAVSVSTSMLTSRMGIDALVLPESFVLGMLLTTTVLTDWRLPVKISLGAACVGALTGVVLRGPGSVVLRDLGWMAAACCAAVFLALCVNEYSRAVLDRARAVVLEDRLAVSRELHDRTAHVLSGLILQIQALQQVGGPPALLAAALPGLEVAARSALNDIRALAGKLRRDESETGPLSLAEIEQVCQRARRLGIPIREHVEHHALMLDLGAEVVDGVLSVIVESLTNVMRHAPHAGLVDVSVSVIDGELVTIIADDATAMGMSQPEPGIGLLGLAERVVKLGGRFHAARAGAEGWRVEARIPIKCGVESA